MIVLFEMPLGIVRLISSNIVCDDVVSWSKRYHCRDYTLTSEYWQVTLELHSEKTSTLWALTWPHHSQGYFGHNWRILKDNS